MSFLAVGELALVLGLDLLPYPLAARPLLTALFAPAKARPRLAMRRCQRISLGSRCSVGLHTRVLAAVADMRAASGIKVP